MDRTEIDGGAVRLSRRDVAIGLAALGAAPALARGPGPALAERLARIERDAGGRLGVAIADADGRLLAGHRADAPFLFCSTFKLFLAGAVLAAVERGRLALHDRVAVSRADLVPYAPVVERAIAAGAMTIDALCAAAVVVSDNAAANLLLARIGGPAGLTAWFRALGGRAARLDRIEPALNLRDGPLDTVPPAEASAMFARLLGPAVLTAASRARLEAWLVESPTGRERLRAGLPAAWRAGSKTGTGPAGETNDLGFVDVPGRGRLFLAVYYEAPGRPLAARQRMLATVGRLAAEGFAPPPR